MKTRLASVSRDNRMDERPQLGQGTAIGSPIETIEDENHLIGPDVAEEVLVQTIHGTGGPEAEKFVRILKVRGEERGEERAGEKSNE